MREVLMVAGFAFVTICLAQSVAFGESETASTENLEGEVKTPMAGAEGIRKALEHEKMALAELKVMLEKENTRKMQNEKQSEVKEDSRIFLEELRSLAGKSIDPVPPSWPLVYYLMIEHDSPGDGDLGAAVAASGEASIFSYARDSIAPMYFSTIGGSQRLKTCTGYDVRSLRTTDAEAAFSFIREGIDTGSGVFVAGPEIGLCYGYNDPGAVQEREVYGFSNWGPAFNGTYSWDKFSKHVEEFGEAEGFAYIHRESQPESAETILQMIAMTVIDWQDQHPATKFGMKQDYYGLAAFKQFIEDVRNPETRAQVDGAYINCHAIIFQLGGRYWLGQYLKQLAERFTDEIKERLIGISDLYLEVHTALNRFKEFDIEGKDEGEIQAAADWLEEAYQADKRILEEFITLRKSL